MSGQTLLLHHSRAFEWHQTHSLGTLLGSAVECNILRYVMPTINACLCKWSNPKHTGYLELQPFTSWYTHYVCSSCINSCAVISWLLPMHCWRHSKIDSHRRSPLVAHASSAIHPNMLHRDQRRSSTICSPLQRPSQTCPQCQQQQHMTLNTLSHSIYQAPGIFSSFFCFFHHPSCNSIACITSSDPH